jgi:hypothetical protein
LKTGGSLQQSCRFLFRVARFGKSWASAKAGSPTTNTSAKSAGTLLDIVTVLVFVPDASARRAHAGHRPALTACFDRRASQHPCNENGENGVFQHFRMMAGFSKKSVAPLVLLGSKIELGVIEASMAVVRKPKGRPRANELATPFFAG